MKVINVFLSIILVIGVLLFAYFYFEKYMPLDKKLSDFKQENLLLAEELGRLKEMVKQTEKKDTTAMPIKEEFKELLEGINITGTDEQLKIILPGKKLFPPGSVEISKEGKELLRQLGNILKRLKNRKILIEGHTDNSRISGTLKKKYPTNWELSAARAVKVVRFLIEEIGIDPKRIAAIAYGEYHPIADNSTSEGRAKNRRIVVTLLRE
ncbi:OmpA family protein [candidate division WOR-3 bacterium]|nr:OmpA family protein [candidate division WOR-3 bacterium]